MQLHDKRAEIAQRGGQVVVITLSQPRWATMWIDDLEVNFPLLFDQNKELYARYGFHHSFRNVWGSPRVALLYVWYVIKEGRWRGFLGDTFQMGGDVILDAQGVIRYLRRSMDPTDRPPVSALIEVMGNC